MFGARCQPALSGDTRAGWVLVPGKALDRGSRRAYRGGATATPYVRVTQNLAQGEKDIRGGEKGMRNRGGGTVRTLGPSQRWVESYVRRIAIAHGDELAGRG
jgi:hypothetical protein